MLYCPQGEGNWCATVFKEKETGALLSSRRRKLVLYCPQGEGNWCSAVLKEKETGALLSSRRSKLVLYCLCFDQEKGTGAMLYQVYWLTLNSDESRQLVLVKFGKHFGFCFQQKTICFIGFIWIQPKYLSVYLE